MDNDGYRRHEEKRFRKRHVVNVSNRRSEISSRHKSYERDFSHEETPYSKNDGHGQRRVTRPKGTDSRFETRYHPNTGVINEITSKTKFHDNSGVKITIRNLQRRTVHSETDRRRVSIERDRDGRPKLMQTSKIQESLRGGIDKPDRDQVLIIDDDSDIVEELHEFRRVHRQNYEKENHGIRRFRNGRTHSFNDEQNSWNSSRLKHSTTSYRFDNSRNLRNRLSPHMMEDQAGRYDSNRYKEDTGDRYFEGNPRDEEAEKGAYEQSFRTGEIYDKDDIQREGKYLDEIKSSSFDSARSGGRIRTGDYRDPDDRVRKENLSRRYNEERELRGNPYDYEPVVGGGKEYLVSKPEQNRYLGYRNDYDDATKSYKSEFNEMKRDRVNKGNSWDAHNGDVCSNVNKSRKEVPSTYEYRGNTSMKDRYKYQHFPRETEAIRYEEHGWARSKPNESVYYTPLAGLPEERYPNMHDRGVEGNECEASEHPLQPKIFDERRSFDISKCYENEALERQRDEYWLNGVRDRSTINGSYTVNSKTRYEQTRERDNMRGSYVSQQTGLPNSSDLKNDYYQEARYKRNYRRRSSYDDYYQNNNRERVDQFHSNLDDGRQLDFSQVQGDEYMTMRREGHEEVLYDIGETAPRAKKVFAAYNNSIVKNSCDYEREEKKEGLLTSLPAVHHTEIPVYTNKIDDRYEVTGRYNNDWLRDDDEAGTFFHDEKALSVRYDNSTAREPEYFYNHDIYSNQHVSSPYEITSPDKVDSYDRIYSPGSIQYADEYNTNSYHNTSENNYDRDYFFQADNSNDVVRTRRHNNNDKFNGDDVFQLTTLDKTSARRSYTEKVKSTDFDRESDIECSSFYFAKGLESRTSSERVLYNGDKYYPGSSTEESAIVCTESDTNIAKTRYSSGEPKRKHKTVDEMKSKTKLLPNLPKTERGGRNSRKEQKSDKNIQGFRNSYEHVVNNNTDVIYIDDDGVSNEKDVKPAVSKKRHLKSGIDDVDDISKSSKRSRHRSQSSSSDRKEQLRLMLINAADESVKQYKKSKKAAELLASEIFPYIPQPLTGERTPAYVKPVLFAIQQPSAKAVPLASISPVQLIYKPIIRRPIQTSSNPTKIIPDENISHHKQSIMDQVDEAISLARESNVSQSKNESGWKRAPSKQEGVEENKTGKLKKKPWFDENCLKLCKKRKRKMAQLYYAQQKPRKTTEEINTIKQSLRDINKEYIPLIRKRRENYLEKLEEEGRRDEICSIVVNGIVDKCISYIKLEAKGKGTAEEIIQRKYGVNVTSNQSEVLIADDSSSDDGEV